MPWRKSVTVGLPLVLVGALAILTWRQTGTYKDSETLYRATLLGNPESWLSRTNLANVLAESGRLSEAVVDAEAAVRLESDVGDTHFSLGNILTHIPGRNGDAVTQYRTAIRVEPSHYLAHLHLGNAYIEMPGRIADAITEYRAAIRIKPDFAEAHYNLGSALAQVPGKTSEAIAEFQTVLRIKPELTPAQRAIELLRNQQ